MALGVNDIREACRRRLEREGLRRAKERYCKPLFGTMEFVFIPQVTRPAGGAARISPMFALFDKRVSALYARVTENPTARTAFVITANAGAFFDNANRFLTYSITNEADLDAALRESQRLLDMGIKEAAVACATPQDVVDFVQADTHASLWWVRGIMLVCLQCVYSFSPSEIDRELTQFEANRSGQKMLLARSGAIERLRKEFVTGR